MFVGLGQTVVYSVSNLFMQSAYMPFEMIKVVVQTKEDMKLKSGNAVFFLSFKPRGGPECRGVVRRTTDGKPGHMCLEARCWIDK